MAKIQIRFKNKSKKYHKNEKALNEQDNLFKKSILLRQLEAVGQILFCIPVKSCTLKWLIHHLLVSVIQEKSSG